MTKNNFKEMREQGFSLIEVLIAVLILGILAAIAVPIFMNQQRQTIESQIKNDMVSAGFLLEQEAIDNNGLYPTYLPNEIKKNKRTETFVYSYDDTRTQWCIQSTTMFGKLFLKSTAADEPTTTSCTLENLAEGTVTPWDKPTLLTPPIPSVTATWALNTAQVKLAMSIPVQACTLAAKDQAEWGSKTKLTYRYLVTNYDRGGVSFVTDWGPSQSVTAPSAEVSGWLPSEKIGIQAQTKCTISNGTDYSYVSKYSSGKAVTIPDFEMPNPTFSSKAATWSGNQVLNVAASWPAFNCPVAALPLGEKKYDFAAYSTTDNKNVGWANRTSDEYNFVSSVDIDSAPGFHPDGQVRIELEYKCKLPNGRTIVSDKVTADLEAGLLPPAKPTGLKTGYEKPSLVTPSKMTWNSVVCAQGTPQYIFRRTVPTYWSSGWITATEYDLNPEVGTSYSFDVEARCVSGAVISAGSGRTASVSYTAEDRAPDAPTGTITITTDRNPSSNYDNTKVDWTAVSCNGWGTVQYLLSRTAPTTGWNSTWMTSRTDMIPYDGGGSVSYRVDARCVAGGLNSSSISKSISFSQPGVLPSVAAAPTGVTVSMTTASETRTGHTVEWNAVSCDVNSDATYQITRTIEGGVTDPNPYSSGWTGKLIYSIPSDQLLFGNTSGWIVQARCTNSIGTTAGAKSAAAKGTLGVPTPATPTASNNGSSKLTWSSVSCPAGTETKYYAWQVTINANTGANSPFYSWGTGNSDVVSNYHEGARVGARVKARCDGVNAKSDESAYDGDTWVVPITSSPDPISIDPGGANDQIIAWGGGGGCPTGTTPSDWELYTNSNYSPWSWNGRTADYGRTTKSVTRPLFNTTATVTMTVRVRHNCYTPYDQGPFSSKTVSKSF